jgi:hypothetical protein
MTTQTERRPGRGEPYAERYAEHVRETVWPAYIRIPAVTRRHRAAATTYLGGTGFAQAILRLGFAASDPGRGMFRLP